MGSVKSNAVSGSLKCACIVSLMLASGVLHAADSLRVMPLRDFLNLVALYHPVARQANLFDEMARQEVRLARAGFEPKLTSEYDYKKFKGTNYYGYFDNGLKVPLWFGELAAGYQNNTGEFTNPSEFTPPGGLEYLGFTLPLGNGLFMDERRAAYRRAQTYNDLAEAERRKMVNKLLYDAVKDYMEWYFAYSKIITLNQAAELVKFELAAVKDRVTAGDAAPYDTLKALVIYQDWMNELMMAENELQNAANIVSNYLWDDLGRPVEIESFLLPDTSASLALPGNATLETMLEMARLNHPELLKTDFKITQFEIDRRLNKNLLLPNINFTYKFLTADPGNFFNDLNSDYLSNNYKLMFNYTQPLFLRKERAKYRMTEIKLDQTRLDRDFTARRIENNVMNAHNDLATWREMIDAREEQVLNLNLLVEGERIKYNNGDSDLLTVNIWLNKYLDTRIKWIKAKAAYEKAKAGAIYEAGMLPVFN